MEDSHLALVRALQHGDDRAFDELLRRHTDAVYRFVRRYVESEADAEDLTRLPPPFFSFPSGLLVFGSIL
jgi:hypothetical protein